MIRAQYTARRARIGAGLLVLVGFTLLSAGCRKEEAVTMSPQAELLLRQGTEALERFDTDQALAYVDSALAVQPGLPDAYLLLGRIYGDRSDLQRSDSAYFKLVELNPEYPGAWNNLGNNAFRAQQYSKAVAYYLKEAEANPAPIPWRGIGRAYVELGKVDSARFAYEKSVAIDSTYAPGYFNLALLHEDEGDLEQALTYARRASLLAPDDLDFKYVMASLLFKTGRAEESVPHLFDVAEQWPWHHASHYNLGQALIRTGHEEQGQAVLQKAEKLRTHDAQITQLINTARMVPNDPLAQAAVGSALRRVGRYEEAMQAYKIATHLDPKNLDVQSNMAVLHLIRKDTLAAVAQYESVLRQDPKFVDAWLNLGVIYALGHRKEEARAAWGRVLEIDPKNEPARQFLARLGRE